MADNAKSTTSTVIPTMRYNDAAAAIEWLCEAFDGHQRRATTARCAPQIVKLAI